VHGARRVAERLAVDLDVVDRRVGGVAEPGDPAVEPDATVSDELLGAPSRYEPGPGDELLEALTRHRC
jgi:hypothetical protein